MGNYASTPLKVHDTRIPSFAYDLSRGEPKRA